DSGSLYRLTALSVLESGGDPSQTADAIRGARAIDLSRAGDPAIRSDKVGRAASHVAAIPEVRQALLTFQRAFLANPPGGSHGAVMDGRDIGTVICPDAAAKLFVDAKPEVRAHRRWLEMRQLGIERPLEEVLEELNARDAADRSRAISPMKQAADADLLDTSDLDIDAALAAALALTQPKVERALKAMPRG
ncbi:MAG: (d)CMP kinase, partial [Alphaproteobacteria bacterium]|nr:(d)CMP kinase [Alphaproteobacteria bacterium]